MRETSVDTARGAGEIKKIDPDPYLWLKNPAPDPAHFVSNLQDAKFLCLFFLFDGTFTSFFRDKKSWRSNKKVEMKGFLSIFAD